MVRDQFGGLEKNVEEPFCCNNRRLVQVPTRNSPSITFHLKLGVWLLQLGACYWHCERFFHELQVYKGKIKRKTTSQVRAARCFGLHNTGGHIVHCHKGSELEMFTYYPNSFTIAVFLVESIKTSAAGSGLIQRNKVSIQMVTATQAARATAQTICSEGSAPFQTSSGVSTGTSLWHEFVEYSWHSMMILASYGVCMKVSSESQASANPRLLSCIMILILQLHLYLCVHLGKCPYNHSHCSTQDHKTSLRDGYMVQPYLHQYSWDAKHWGHPTGS